MASQHYAEFKRQDPALIGPIVETFPFATILVNGPESPLVAQAPLTWRDDGTVLGAVEFHLSRANPVVASMPDGTTSTIVVQGPSAAISPSWYEARFPGPKPDRSRTAPTFNYVTLLLRGRIRWMKTDDLHRQVADLVAAHEPQDGWRLSEMDPVLFRQWCEAILGFRMEVEEFDLTAKLSQEQSADDRPGIVAGLQRRGRSDDLAAAQLINLLGDGQQDFAAALSAVCGKILSSSQ